MNIGRTDAMSNPKITPKNLSYDGSLPPFLQRLHANNTSSADGRHERAIARPRRARDADADAEDEPAYVDEETNHTLSKEEYAALVGGKDEDRDAKETKTAGEDAEEKKIADKKNDESAGANQKEKEKLASIGGSRKRKVVKVVGTGSDEEDGIPQNGDTTQNESKGNDVAKTSGAISTKPTKKLKPKKVKLSFNDDEGS
jgi:hypothetical protein